MDEKVCLTEIGDLEVVQMVKDGNRSAFSALVRRHQKSLLRLSLRFVKDVDTAEDVVQESFIKAYERLHSFEARASFKSWLFQIAVNTAKNKLREKRDTTDVYEASLGVSAEAESILVHSAIAKLIQSHVEQLPFKQKTALMLRIYEDLSFKEIAEIMECPYDTAKANYRHALLRLRDELKDQQELDKWSFETTSYITDLTRRAAEVE